MIARAKCSDAAQQESTWHAGFLKMLPRIEKYARIAFRSVPSSQREELVQEAICNTLVAYKRLFDLGKTSLAYPSVLGRYAVAQIRTGRRVGASLNANDALAEYAQRKRGHHVESLSYYDTDENAWREIAVEDKRSTPADVAATRIDFSEWLQRLPVRHRKMALKLATGESTTNVARRYRLSLGRISQIRAEMRNSWETFQSGTLAAGAGQNRPAKRVSREKVLANPSRRLEAAMCG